MEDLSPEPLPSDAWLAIIEREYLADFVPQGGGGLKVVVAEPVLFRPMIGALTAMAGRHGLFPISVDAAGTRLHLPQELFSAAARALPWPDLLRTYLEAVFARHGYPWPRPGLPMTRIELAEALEIAPPLLTSEINTWLTREIWQNRRYALDFRAALLALCRATLDADPAVAEPVLQWLGGEKVPPARLKEVGIGGRITRVRARAMLVSLCHWVRASGAGGLLMTLDIRRLHQSAAPTDGGVRYGPASVMDSYEVLRELIDDIEQLPGLCVVVLATADLIGGDPRRTIDRYDALKMRVWPDVRPSAGQNPLAPLVWVGR